MNVGMNLNNKAAFGCSKNQICKTGYKGVNLLREFGAKEIQLGRKLDLVAPAGHPNHDLLMRDFDDAAMNSQNPKKMAENINKIA